MKLAWMGQQRELIDALFQWGNSYAALYRKPISFLKEDGIALTPSEMQVIEYLLENEELKLNMAGVARRLGISPSAFTQIVSKLEKLELVEKYSMENNHKDMIVIVTDRGIDVYNTYSRRLYELWQQTVLAPLAQVPEEYQKVFAQVLRSTFLAENDQTKSGRGNLIPNRKRNKAE